MATLDIMMEYDESHCQQVFVWSLPSEKAAPLVPPRGTHVGFQEVITYVRKQREPPANIFWVGKFSRPQNDSLP